MVMKEKIWGEKKIKKEEDQIKRLFIKCYDKKISKKKFDQLYKKNPYGESRAIALKKSDELIGFYGLIPQKISKRLNEKKLSMNYLLGVSLMISPEFRDVSTLAVILKRVDKHIGKTNYITVLGFPNEQSIIPLTTLFGWNIVEEAKFYTCKVKNANQNAKIKDIKESKILSKNKWCVPYEEEEFIEWKEICNSYNTVEINNDLKVVYKKYKNKIDILDVSRIKNGNVERENLESLVERERASGFIITNYHAKKIGVSLKKCEGWNNGKIRLCSLGDGVESKNLHLSLLMSDVF